MKQPFLLLIFAETSKTLHQIRQTLQNHLPDFTYQTVQSETQFLKAINEQPPAAILADFDLKTCPALEVLNIKKEHCDQVPLIVISGTPGEKHAVQAMKSGAADYLLKDNLTDLVETIQHFVNLQPEPILLPQTAEIANRYYNLFEESPISLWETDFSGSKAYLDELVKNGVTDLRSYLDENPAEVLEISKRRRIVDINQTTIDMYHAKDKQEAIEKLGMTFSDKSLEIFKDELIQLFSGKTEITGEAEHKTLNGETIFVSFKESVASGYEQNWGKVYTTLLDITSLKQAEFEKSHSENLLRTIIDRSPDWIFLKDEDHRYRLANKMFAESIGRTPEEIIGKTDPEIGLSHQSKLDEANVNYRGFLSTDDRVFESNQEVRSYGVELSHENGSKWIFDSFKVPMPETIEGKKTLLGIARDITTLRNAEREKEQSEKMLRTIIDTSPDWIYLKDEEHRYHLVNQTFLDNIQLSYDEIIGKTPKEIGILEYIHHHGEKKEHNNFDYADDPVFEHKEVNRTYGIEVFHENGGSWIFDSVKVPMPDLGDGKKLLLGISRDITERHRTELALEETRKEYEYLFNSIVDSIFITNMESKFLAVNDMTCERLGYTREELLTMNASDIDTPEFKQTVRKKIRTVREKNFHTFITAHQTKDGRELPLEANASLIEFQGEPALLVIARDISDRIMAEKALKESEQKFRYLYQTIPDAIFILDETGKIIEVNQVLCDLLGYKEDEILNHHNSYFSKSSRESVETRIEQIKSEGFANFETSLKTKSGQRLEIHVAAKRIEYNGKPAIMNIAHDTTSKIIAQEELSENEELLQQIMDTNPTAIWVIDEEGRYLMVNKTSEQFFQMHREELIGLTNMDLARRNRITMAEAEQFHLNALQVAKTKSTFYASEQSFTDKDGVTHWLQIRLIPLLQNNDSQMILGIGNEITEQRQAREELHKSEEMLRAILNNAPNHIFVVNNQDRYLICNKASAESIGTTSEFLEGKSLQELAKLNPHFEKNCDAYLSLDREVIETQQEKTIEAQPYTNQDGEENFMQFRLVPLNIEGQLPMMLGIGTDVTAKIMAAQQLEAANETLEQRVYERTYDLAKTTEELQVAKEQIELILNTTQDGLLLLDKDTTILLANPAACHWMKFPEDQLLGYKLLNFIEDDFSEEFGALANHFFANQETLYYELETRGPNQNLLDLAITVSPVIQYNEMIGIIITLHDISELKELQRMKDAFVSNVSHELRTPITNFICNLELIRRKPDQTETYLNRLDLEVEQLRTLIEDLLRLSRLDQNAIQLKMRPFDLNKLCADFTAMRAPMVEQKRLNLSFVPTNNLPLLTGDYGLINQTLSIFFTNAINYAYEEGEIIIRTHLGEGKHAGQIAFSISDNGPGIKPEDHSRVFERFYRGDAGLQSGVSGTGLGLSIAHEIISRHQGEIELISTGIQGEGTTFYIWLNLDM